MKRHMLTFLLSFLVIGFILSNAVSVDANLCDVYSFSSLNSVDAIELNDFSEFEHEINSIFLASENTNSSIDFRRQFDNEPIFNAFGEQYLYTVPTNFLNQYFEFELEIGYQYLDIDEVGTLQIHFLCDYSDDLNSYDKLSIISFIKLEGDHFTNETAFGIGRGVDEEGTISIGSGKLVDLDTLPKTDILFRGSRNSSEISLEVFNNQSKETIIAETFYDGLNFSVSHICIEYLTNYQNGNFNASVCNFKSIIYGNYLPAATFTNPTLTIDLGGRIYLICSIQITFTFMIQKSRKKNISTQ